DKALNNAAFCYQQEFRFDSALKLYERLFTQYPQSPLADTALFLVGFSAEKSFEFDKAIASYERLVANYPQSAKRADALYNEAQAAYTRYAQLFPEREDAPEMLLRGASMAERSKDFRRQISDLQDFVRRFPRNGERVVQALLQTGLAWKQLGDEAAARQAFEEACAEFDRRRFTPQD